MSQTALLSTRTVKQLDDFSEAFFLAKPRKYPTATLLQMGGARVGKSEKLQWGEKSIIAWKTKINNVAGYGAGDTDFTVDSTEGMAAGCTLYFPRVQEYAICGDITSTTRIGGGGTACIRGAFSSTPAILLDNDDIFIMSTPRAENYAFSDVTPTMIQSDDLYNLYEISVEHVGISNTEQAIMANGGVAYGDDYANQVAEALARVKARINRAALFGALSTTNVGTYQKRRTAGGIAYYAYTKDYSVGDISDSKNLEDKMETVLQNVQGDVALPCSWQAFRAFQYTYQNQWQGALDGKILNEVGIEVRNLNIMGVRCSIYWEPDMIDYLDTTVKGQFMAYPKSDFKVSYLRSPGRYKVPPTTDGLTEGILAEFTFQCKGAKQFGVFGGVTKIS